VVSREFRNKLYHHNNRLSAKQGGGQGEKYQVKL